MLPLWEKTSKSRSAVAGLTSVLSGERTVAHRSSSPAKYEFLLLPRLQRARALETYVAAAVADRSNEGHGPLVTTDLQLVGTR
jgi:hypothetical protein